MTPLDWGIAALALVLILGTLAYFAYFIKTTIDSYRP